MPKTLAEHPLWIQVAAGLIVAAVVSGIGYVANSAFGWWEALAGYALDLFVFLRATSTVPNWLAALVLVLALPTIVVLVMLIWKLMKPMSEKDWRSYRSDIILGLRWRWDYAGDRVNEVVPFCPHCDFQLFPRNNGPQYGFESHRFYFECENCGGELPKFDESYRQLEGRVIRTVQLNLRKGIWSEGAQTAT